MSDPITIATRHGHVLIPIEGKAPRLKGWPDHPGLSPAEARDRLYSGGNVGMLCGHRSGRLLIVDVDGERPEGLPETPTVQTGGGGLHLYYRVPDGVDLPTANKCGVVAEGVDIRYTGAQVVYPGSVHPETGALYEWVPGMSPDDLPVADVPQWVLDALLSPAPAPVPATVVAEASRDLAAGADRYLTASLDGACLDIRTAPEGQRNDTLNTRAFAMAGLPFPDMDAVRDALIAAGCEAGLSEFEARKTVQSGMAAGKEKPRAVSAPQPRTHGTSAAMPEIREAVEIKPSPRPAPFRVLGYNDGKYYFLPSRGGQVVDLTAPQLAQKPNLFRLAPLAYLEAQFGSPGKGFDGTAACAALVEDCEHAGLYTIDRLRGRGAWHDAGRIVLHRGDSLLVDGKRMDLHEIDSRYVYQREPYISIPYDHPLTVDDARRGILSICEDLCWEREIYGRLLAGWLALAPICGVLDWRPHIWITGASGSGKSYVQDHVIDILRATLIKVQGCSTEAGVRQLLKVDALAVSFDEAESETQRAAMNIQRVLELARQASSNQGGVIAKGTADGHAMQFNIRSMFCMSSVGVGVTKRSDQSRVTILPMVLPQAGPDGLARFKELEELTAIWCTGDAASSFIARSCHMAQVIRASAKVFAETFAAMKTNRRNADQIGTLLAGYWSLLSDHAATAEDARVIVADLDLDGVTPDEDQNDEKQFVAHLLQSRVRCEIRDPAGNARQSERAVIELVDIAANKHDQGEDHMLQRYGMRCLGEGLFVSNSHPGLAALLRDTQWGADWKRFARRISSSSTASTRILGATVRGVIIPYSAIFY